jgi:hypothetical protein
MKAGHCLGPEGNGVSSGEGREGGPGPPGSREDKQSTPSKEGGNMEKEEEGRASQKKDQSAQSELFFKRKIVAV